MSFDDHRQFALPAVSVPTDVVIVVIGRNEGERLKACLARLAGHFGQVTYCDSGSRDGSLEHAQALGVQALALDPARPFTAARGRNEGFAAALKRNRDARYVQFIDGDCELTDDWLLIAKTFLDANPGVAVVCGRLRERFPERSVYNRLADAEWDRPAGQTAECGGIAMMRVDAFQAMKGFREDIPAGEEPELCRRMRDAGWKIWRLADAMALHDAAMTRLGQWWVRSRRGGFAFAQAFFEIKPRERYNVRAVASSWIWAVGVPLLAAAAVLFWGFPGVWVLAIYPLQVLRLALRLSGPWRPRFERAFFLTLGRFAEVAGHFQFLGARRRRVSAPQNFDYKS